MLVLNSFREVPILGRDIIEKTLNACFMSLSLMFVNNLLFGLCSPY